MSDNQQSILLPSFSKEERFENKLELNYTSIIYNKLYVGNFINHFCFIIGVIALVIIGFIRTLYLINIIFYYFNKSMSLDCNLMLF